MYVLFLSLFTQVTLSQSCKKQPAACLTECQPDGKANPGCCRQGNHKPHVGHYREDWSPRYERYFEVRLVTASRLTSDDHTATNYGEETADDYDDGPPAATETTSAAE